MAEKWRWKNFPRFARSSLYNIHPGTRVATRTLELAVQKHESATRAHPDNWKNEGEKFFRASRGMIGATRLYALPSAAFNYAISPSLSQILHPPLVTPLIDTQNVYSSAFLFELIGWAYFRVINDPLQQLVMKKGGGCIFERLVHV